MSSDITSNQVMKDANVAASQVRGMQGSNAEKRPDVAAMTGTKLPPETTQAQDQTKEVTAEKAQEVVEQLNKHAQAVNRDLLFSVDDDSGRTVIKVINSDTAELVRQIPSEEVLKLSETIRETLENNTGVIVQTSA